MVVSTPVVSNAAKVARKKGALSVVVAATHGVLSGDAIQKLSSDDIDKVILSDTVNIPEEKQFKKLTVVSSANIFAETINRIHTGESVSELFGESNG